MTPSISLRPGPAPINQSDPWNEKAGITVEFSPQQTSKTTETFGNANFNPAGIDTGAKERSDTEAKLTYEPKFELESRAIDEFRPLKACCLMPLYLKIFC